MPRRRRLGRARGAVAGLAVAGLAVAAAGCGQGPPNPTGQGPGSASGSPPASPSATSSGRPLAPLTGLPAASTADAAKPAVALMVSGTNPVGLGSADIVYEEISSVVRYIAVYQSSQTATVGPITTTSPTDREALAVLHPVVGYDGAAAGFIIKLLDATKVIDAGYAGHPSLYTSAADGLTTTPQTLAQGVKGGTAPPPMFQYRGSGSGTSLLAARGVSRPTGVSLTIPGLGTQNWSFDSHSDRWSLTSGGPAVQVANLVVQDVSYKTVNINPKHGITVAAAEITGGGKAEVFSGSASGSTSSGTAASGIWSKPHVSSVTNFFTSNGTTLMSFLPGPTWVILAPPGTQVATSGT